MAERTVFQSMSQRHAISLGPNATIWEAACAMTKANCGSVLIVDTLGALLGIVTAVVLGWLLFRGAIRLDLRKFFLFTGAALIVIAAGVLAYGIHDLQEAAIIPGLDTLAWDLGYSASSWYGTLLKGIFNFSPRTTVLEAAVWLLYVAIVLPLFLRRPKTADPVAATPAPAAEANAPA